MQFHYLRFACICLSIKGLYKSAGSSQSATPSLMMSILSVFWGRRDVLTCGQSCEDCLRVLKMVEDAALEVQYITKPQVLQMSLAVRFIDSQALWTILILVGSPQTSLHFPGFCTGLPHGYQVGLPCTSQVFFQRTKGAQFGHTNHARDLQRYICTLLHYLGTHSMLLPASSPAFTIFLPISPNYITKT